MSAQVCIKYASGVQFYQRKYFSRKTFLWYAGLVQNTCILCTLCADLVHTFSEKVCIWRTMHTWPECASLQKSGMHTLHTFFSGVQSLHNVSNPEGCPSGSPLAILTLHPVSLSKHPHLRAQILAIVDNLKLLVLIRISLSSTLS